MRNDGLAGVARLRGREVTQAEQGLRNAALERQRAEGEAARIAGVLVAEEPESAPTTYGAWLALQLALRHEARTAETTAEIREGTAREALVEARRAEKVVALLFQQYMPFDKPSLELFSTLVNQAIVD